MKSIIMTPAETQTYDEDTTGEALDELMARAQELADRSGEAVEIYTADGIVAEVASPNAEAHWHCGCGAWTSERCAWTGPAGEMVVVEFVPESERGTFRTLGYSVNSGYAGTERRAVCRDCADLYIAGDADFDGDGPDWARIIDAPVTEYAERA